MRVSSRRSNGYLTALTVLSAVLSPNFVFAGPIDIRADASTSTTSSLSSTTSSASAVIASTAASSSASVETTSGTATTTSASLTASAAATTTGTSSESGEVPHPTDLITCHDSSGTFAPFCQPTNGSDVYVGDSYYVTWNPDAYTINTTIKIFLDYVDPQGGGLQAWESNETKNSYGYVAVKMDPAWLNGNSRNNLTFYIGSLNPSVDKQMSTQGGPIVSLVNKPVLHYLPSPNTPAPKEKALAIGLPVAVAVVVLIAIGLCVGMKKHRKIGLGNIMGRRQGYGVGKSRRQRLKLGRKDGAIRLGEEAAPGGGGFRDKPSTSVELHERAHVRQESLGSLVSSPDDDHFTPQSMHQGNAFRDEVSRQQTGRG